MENRQASQNIKELFSWPALVFCGAALLAGAFSAWFGFLGLALVFLGAITAVLVMRIFSNPWFGIILLTLVLPFERFGSIELGGLTLRASQVFGGITLVAFLASMLVVRKLHFRNYPATLPLLAFVGLMLFSLTQAENLQRGILIFSFILFTILVHLLVPNLVTTRERLRTVVQVLFIITGIITIFGVFQFFGDVIGLPTSITGLRDLYTSEVFGFPRIQSTFLEPLYFANFLLIPIGLLLAYLFSPHRPFRLIILYPLLGLSVLNLVLTLSRGGYIGFAITALVVGLYSLRKLLSPKRIFLGALLILIVGYAFLQIFAFTGQQTLLLDRFVRQATDIFSGASFFDRQSTFQQAYDLFRSHPWLGVGVGNFGPAIADHPLQQPVTGWLIVNNEFLELLAETGILGLTAFIAFLVTLFFRSVQLIRSVPDSFEKRTLIGLLGAFLGILAQYQTFSVLFIMHIWFLFGLLVATQNLIVEENKTHA